MKTRISQAALAATALISFTVSAAPTVEELWETVQKQQKEIEELKKEQKETEQKVEATADAVESAGSGTGVVSSKATEWAAKTRLGGYGELHYNNFENSDDRVDAHRFVLYVAHDFSDSVKFFSEVELEHSLAGDGAPGEVELEQAYIEWQFAENHALVSGLFLIPVGILNETHEPDTFYGVERNRIENSIIPTTWWETGAMLTGEFAPGLSYNFAVHSGLAVDDGGTVRGGRQKSAEAIANDLAYTARIKYTGIAGLELAATLQLQEEITQGIAADDSSATLTELHAIYQYGGFGLRALYADWSIDGAGFEATGRDSQTGWYIEPSYRFTEQFGVFVRFNNWNNEAGLAANDDNEVTDIGFNYWLHPNVVFKVDYQDASDYNENDSLNLGVGWSF